MDKELVGQFIDAAVDDHDLAEQLLAKYPELRQATWVLSESLVHFLTIEYYIKGVRWLLEHEFDPNVPDEFGETALMSAVQMSYLDIARLLVDYGADVTVVSPCFGSLLEMVTEHGSDEQREFVRNILREKAQRDGENAEPE